MVFLGTDILTSDNVPWGDPGWIKWLVFRPLNPLHCRSVHRDPHLQGPFDHPILYIYRRNSRDISNHHLPQATNMSPTFPGNLRTI